MYGLGIFQFSPVASITDNLALIVKALAVETDRLVLLPELFLCDYFKPEFILTRTLQETLEPLLDLSKKNHLAIAGSLALEDVAGIRQNTFVYINNGHVLAGDYAKHRLFRQEHSRFVPGDTDIGLIDYNGLRVATKICMDVLQPISLSQACAQNTIDLLLVTATVSVDYLVTITKARSLENQLICLFANRSLAVDHPIKFLGQSGFYFPDGTSQSTDASFVGLLKVDIDDEQLKRIRNTREYLGIYPQERRA